MGRETRWSHGRGCDESDSCPAGINREEQRRRHVDREAYLAKMDEAVKLAIKGLQNSLNRDKRQCRGLEERVKGSIEEDKAAINKMGIFITNAIDRINHLEAELDRRGDALNKAIATITRLEAQ